MRALIDTHALLWWVADSARLSGTARAVIADDSNDIFVSAASAWELATKFRLGKLPGGERVAADVVACIASQGFLELGISVADAQRAGRLAGAHRDPFDHMLIAQVSWTGCGDLWLLSPSSSDDAGLRGSLNTGDVEGSFGN